jgi:hypothetical protein
MGQRHSGVHRGGQGILQDGKPGEFFPDIFSFESSAGTRRAGLVLEIIVSHPYVRGRGSRPVRRGGCNHLRVLLPAERDHVQGGTAQRCSTSQGHLGIVERDELGALFDPACGSDSIVCVVAQDLFDKRGVRRNHWVGLNRLGPSTPSLSSYPEAGLYGAMLLCDDDEEISKIVCQRDHSSKNPQVLWDLLVQNVFVSGLPTTRPQLDCDPVARSRFVMH